MRTRPTGVGTPQRRRDRSERRPPSPRSQADQRHDATNVATAGSSPAVGTDRKILVKGQASRTRREVAQQPERRSLTSPWWSLDTTSPSEGEGRRFEPCRGDAARGPGEHVPGGKLREGSGRCPSWNKYPPRAARKYKPSKLRRMSAAMVRRRQPVRLWPMAPRGGPIPERDRSATLVVSKGRGARSCILWRFGSFTFHHAPGKWETTKGAPSRHAK